MRLTGLFATVCNFSSRDTSTPEALISPPSGDRPANHALCKNVEFIHQQHVNMCGDACVNMLFAYKGKAYERMFKRNPRGVLEGLDTQQVKDKLMEAELLPVPIPYPENRKWPAQQLASLIIAYGPLICAGKRHFILVFGADQNKVVYHDPWRGPNKQMSLDDFNRFLRWSDDHCIIAADDPRSIQPQVPQPALGMNRSTYNRLSLRMALEDSSGNPDGERSAKFASQARPEDPIQA